MHLKYQKHEKKTENGMFLFLLRSLSILIFYYIFRLFIQMHISTLHNNTMYDYRIDIYTTTNLVNFLFVVFCQINVNKHTTHISSNNNNSNDRERKKIFKVHFWLFILSDRNEMKKIQKKRIKNKRKNNSSHA